MYKKVFMTQYFQEGNTNNVVNVEEKTVEESPNVATEEPTIVKVEQSAAVEAVDVEHEPRAASEDTSGEVSGDRYNDKSNKKYNIL